MEAVFITERIILLSGAESISDSTYRPAVKQISAQLQLDYGPDHYLIINVSEPRSDLIRLNNSHVRDKGWPATLAPPLERLCGICKEADVWINTHPRNVLIIHCKGGLGRAAVVVASYMHYTSICAAPNQALDRYAMKHFFDDELRRHILPSQRRYVQYFSALLNGSTRINSDPVYLSSITLLQVPNFDGKAGCRPCFKVYQNNEHIWTSEVYSMSESEERRILTIHLRPALQLRGDIMIKCYHYKRMRPDLKDIIFRCQVHTCAIQEGLLILNKGELDEACNDIRFRDDASLELTFCQASSSTIFDAHSQASHQPGRLPDRTFDLRPSSPQTSLYPENRQWDRALTLEGDSVSHLEEERPLPPMPLSSLAGSHHIIDASLSARSRMLCSDGGVTEDDTPLPPAYDPHVTYAKVQKKVPAVRRKASDQTLACDLQFNSPGSVVVSHPSPLYQSGESLDSGISAVPYVAPVASLTDPVGVMDGRSASPGGTMKSVKFRDVPHNWPAQTNSRLDAGPTALRNGMQVVDLDTIQPDMEELDRVFESLQADSEDLEKQQYKLSSQKEDKNTSLPPKYQTDPRRVLENETGTGLINGLTSSSFAAAGGDSTMDSETDTASVTGQDSPFISSYVPQDRKGLGKKYGAFTFGLPTARPELKPITSPQPRRRGEREPPSFSDTELEGDKYGRSRLRHVQQDAAGLQRSRAQERLYNTSALSPSPTRQLVPQEQQTPPLLTSQSPQRPALTNQTSLDSASTYGRIQSNKPASLQASQQQSQQSSLPRRVPSPSPPRPKTPTEEERLQRLLNVEQGEFLVVDDEATQDRYRSPLKEIARESGHSQQRHQQVKEGSWRQQAGPEYSNSVSNQDIKMETEDYSTGHHYQDSPLPERKKKKKTGGTESTVIQQARGAGQVDASSWLQMQHDKLMTRKYGSDYSRRKDKETALLEELRSSQERMIEQVPNRELDENRLPLSSIVLREAKTPPLVRRADDDAMEDNSRTTRENPGYRVVRNQLTTKTYPNGQASRREIITRHESFQSHPTAVSYSERQRIETNSAGDRTTDVDTDHDSIADEVDFGDEPLYKSPSSYRVSRSRDVDESRLRSTGASYSNPTSPDPLRRTAAASPKSILKNTTLPRGRYATSEDRAASGTVTTTTLTERPITPNFPPEKEQTGSLSRNNSLQRGYSLYGTRDRVTSGNTATLLSGRSTPTGYFGVSSRRASLTSLHQAPPAEEIYVVEEANPVFVRDLSKLWYKPGISREETIDILKDKPAGSFLIRDSNSFPGAYGLAVKVDADHLSANNKGGGQGQSPAELVRHFLIEPSNKGVHLKGCQNEPVFGSLSALVYQHSITPLALPCRLLLPKSDMTLSHQNIYSEDNLQRLMDQGAACNVFYLLTLDTESLTGPQAIRRTMTHVQHGHPIKPTVVHFKVNAQGIILTDNKRRLFFRRHYPIQTVSFCGLDPDDRRWTFKSEESAPPTSARCFGFISRKTGSYNQNECHLFAELEAEQPAGAVVSFVTKVMMTATSLAERRSQVPHSHAVDQKAAGPFTSLDSMTLSRQRDGHANHPN